MSLVTKLSSVLEQRLSRRSFVARSAFVGSAITAGGVGFMLKPGTAYAALCFCGDAGCGCGTTCCAGYTEFCCVINGGYNSCPANTVMGGWWQAEGSEYCEGARYYMDCNGVCECTNGCGEGYSFCEPSCDWLDCGCAGGTCDNYLTGCFQFRYGQCNQDVHCIGRIKCRVVTCVPPWEIDPSCTQAIATDDGTADQNAGCVTPGPTYPPPPPPVCNSPETDCKVVGLAMSRDAKGYGMVTAFGKAFFYGDDDNVGQITRTLAEPVTAIVTSARGGYWFATAAGRVYAYGEAKYYGDAYDKHLAKPIVAMAGTPSGNGYWLMSSAGRVLAFGDAVYYGEPPSGRYPSPFVGMGRSHTGKGYWLLTSGGRVLNYGDATEHPQVDFTDYKQPFVAITVTPSGRGYWLVTSAAQVVPIGSAGDHGASKPQKLPYPIVDMASTPTGRGYYLVGTDGGVLVYGDAVFHGSPVETISSVASVSVRPASVTPGSVSIDPSAGRSL
jgi:hypothetical protein